MATNEEIARAEFVKMYGREIGANDLDWRGFRHGYVAALEQSSTASMPGEQEPIGMYTTIGGLKQICWTKDEPPSGTALYDRPAANTDSKAPIDQRARFEAWAADNGFSTKLRNDNESPDTYFAYETEQRWLTWQAAMQVRQVPQWQPIESAPRDGTRIIGLVGNRACTIQGTQYTDHIPGGKRWFGWSEIESGAHVPRDPKGWMPLPAAPVNQIAQDDK